MNFFATFLLMKDCPVFFNEFLVELFEDMIIRNVGNFFSKGDQDYESFFNLTLICYEIYCCNLFNKEDYFSNKFLKLLRTLNFWFDKKFWERFYDYLCKLFVNNKVFLYFTNILKPKKEKKKKIKNYLHVYEMLTFIGFYFLKIPFQTLFDHINHLQETYNSVPSNLIYDLSKSLEIIIIENYLSKREKIKSKRNLFKKKNKVLICLKKALWYLNYDSSELKDLMFLSSDLYYPIKKLVLCVFIRKEEIEREKRINLWINIALTCEKLKSIEKSINESQVYSLEERCVHVLKMDVKRTNFVKKDKALLIRLLHEVASKHPATSYYQGMNCIGGFFLNYTDNYSQSSILFNYLVSERLEKYFLDNFVNLKKLLYLVERTLEKNVPKIHSYFCE